MRESRHVEVAVVGAGPAGLTAAYRLRDACDVRLFERRNRVGGRAATVERDGYRVDLGAHVLRADGGLLEELIEALELAEAVCAPGSRCRKRFLVRDGRLIPRPESLWDLIRSPLLSIRGKCRLLAEPFVSPGMTSREESLASFVGRRLGREVVEYAAEPVAAGMFGGAPEGLELGRVFPRLAEAVREHGSLGAALLEATIRRWGNGRDERRGSEAASNGERRIFTFRGGTSTLTEALAETLEGRIHRNVTVRDVERVSGGYRFVAEGPEGCTSWTAEHVITAVPACRLSDLFGGVDGTETRRIAAVPHPPIAVLALGYRRSQIEHPLDGFGFLVPRAEPYDLTGVLFSSRLDPGRAPEDCELLTCYLGGAQAPELLEQGEAELLRRARSDLRALLGVEGAPRFTHQQRWEAAIPQYAPGHDRVVRAAARFERRYPGLHLAGNYRRGISVVDAMESGWRAAERLLRETPELAV